VALFYLKEDFLTGFICDIQASADERHYTPQQLAELWSLSATKIRELFENESGVLRIGEPSRRIGRALKRSYFTMRIPQSVAERVYKKLTA